ncbi:MAG: hypothetical protein IT269_09685, partial [Saprospiraceae bacterium]|nr:hypothetical protein [Saprospiraceae bacterium]
MPVKHQQPLMRLWRGPLLRHELGRVITLALPLMLGELSGMLMGVIGTMMVGHLGAATLAASGVASVVFVISMLLVWGGIRMIPTPVAEAHELRDGQKMRTLITAALILSAFFMVVSCSLMGLGTHFFHLLGQDPEVERLALEYLNVIIIGMPMLVLMAMLFNFADAFEYVRLTMWVSIFGLALDVFLNWLFIYGHWGMPVMGIKAVAMNTGISNAAIFTLLLTLLWRKKDLQYIRH